MKEMVREVIEQAGESLDWLSELVEGAPSPPEPTIMKLVSELGKSMHTWARLARMDWSGDMIKATLEVEGGASPQGG